MGRLGDILAGRMVPEIDALPFDGLCFESSQLSDLGQGWKEQGRASVCQACDILKPQFGEALLLHRIPALIHDMTHTIDFSPACIRAGLVYACLDLFYAGQCPPTINDVIRRTDRSQKLRDYVRSRTLESAALGLPKILAWLAVLRGIPEQWIPAEKIARRLQALVGAMATTSHVDVEIDLRLPVPGGKEWLNQESVADFGVLLRAHRDRNPVAVVLLMESTNDVEALPVIVVKASARDSQGVMVYFDPFFPGQIRSACIDLQSGKIKSSNSSGANILGVMTMAYGTRTPSFSNFKRLQAKLHITTAIWYVARLWRLAALQS